MAVPSHSSIRSCRGSKLHRYSLKDACQTCWFAHAELYHLGISSIGLYDSSDFADSDQSIRQPVSYGQVAPSNRSSIELNMKLLRHSKAYNSRTSNRPESNVHQEETDMNYPHGMKVALIMTSAYLSMFLVALVRTPMPTSKPTFH